MQNDDGLTYRFVVQPKRHPRHHHNHESWDVNSNDIIRELTLEGHINRETAIFSYEINKKYLN